MRDPDAAVLASEEAQSVHIDPEGPRLAQNEITLGAQETFALAGELPSGKGGDITYTSGNTAVARVSAEGLITAVAPGETRVRAEAPSGAWSECLVHVKKQPDSVCFSQDVYTIGKGEFFDGLRVIVGSAEGQFAGGYTITPKNRKIVEVGENGIIRGKKKGSTVLTVRTYNGRTATCKVTVKKAPKRVKLYSDKKTLGVGETATLTYKLTKKSAGRVTFVSEAPSIASVDIATGAVTARASGSARLRATSYNGKKGYVTVTVKPEPKKLTVEPGEMTVGVGMELKLVPALNSGSAGEVRFSSVDAAIAKVNAEGIVQGLKPGETLVRARTYNGLTAECRVVVKPAPKAVTLPYQTLYIGVGETVRLEPEVGDSVSTFTYKSSSKRKVKAYADGTVKGVKKGKAKITIQTYNGKKLKLKVVVRKAPKRVTISPESAEMFVGEALQFTSALPKKSAGAVTYSSSNADIVKVDAQTGRATALAPGKATVTARSYNGKTSASQVVVYSMPTWIEADTSLVELSVGMSYVLSAKITPGSRSPIRYSSADKAVAAVDENGRITAKAVGNTTITLKTNAPGVTDTVSVSVLPAPSEVTLDAKSLTLDVEQTCKLTPSIPSGTMTVYTYSSSDPDVASISKDGAVVALSRGTTTLTVTTHNGRSASVKLKVLDPWYPDSASLLNVPDQLKIGDTWLMDYKVSPVDAKPVLQWSSSNTKVATVDGSGRIKALASGYSVIRAVSAKNPDIDMEFTLAVQMSGITMVIPARTTDIAGIPANLAKIDAIRTTAIAQIDALRDGGVIGSSDAKKRRSMVNNIFKDYAFPWMTPELQKYWKKANSEGGLKDFKPDTVYYGMPYISGSGFNRRYNSAKAISEKRYINSGAGYYLLNRDNLLNGKYVGNDCSGLVDQAIWGTNSSHSGDRTVEIDASTAYKTITDPKAMRPGDLICKPYGHVVMFLYYTNPEKTQMMIIENGGTELGTNTVHCCVMKMSYYQKKGYRIRRLKSLG